MNFPKPDSTREEDIAYMNHHIKLMMYMNGIDFLNAAEGIRHKGYDKQNPVYYHLICQGLEILWKYFLWIKLDITPEDSRKRFGHKFLDLYKFCVEKEVIKKYSLEMMDELDWWYVLHYLRYPEYQGVSTRPYIANYDEFEEMIDDCRKIAEEYDKLIRLEQ